jgi:PIN domain nuclease of toxin-antitoxin system
MKASILLDTCAAIYIMENEWMRPAAVVAIDEASDRDEKVFVSPITAWEIGMLSAKGRFKSSHAPRRWWDLLLARRQIGLTDMLPQLLLESSWLPGNLHRDPADRVIAATAREYGLTVMTRDRALLDYAREGHLSALEC